MSTVDLIEIKEALDAIKEGMTDFGKRQELQTQLLIGNPMDKDDGGILGRVKKVEIMQEETEERVDRLEVGKKEIAWTMAGFVGAATVFIAILDIAIKYIFNSHS